MKRPFYCFRKLFCILTALVCVTACAASASADRHVEIQGVFSGTLDGRALSFDLYEQENKVFAVTSLITEYAAVSDDESGTAYMSCVDTAFSLCPEAITKTVQTAEQIMISWLSQQRSESSSGMYTGDLFDSASERISYDFLLSDFLRYMNDYLRNNSENAESHDPETMKVFTVIAEMLQDIVSDIHPLIRWQEYDEGRYCSVLVLHHDETVLTVSVDRTSDAGKRILISSRENGIHYFRDYEISTDRDRCTVTSAFLSSSSSSFRTADRQAPMLIENIKIWNESDTETGFQYTAETSLLRSILVFNGMISRMTDGTGEISAALFLQENKNEQLAISARLEPLYSAVSFSDKQIRHQDNEKERAEVQLAFISGLTMLAAEILPALPADYQNMLIKMIFE